MEPMCPACHVIVRPTDYFCFNCGKNLHEKPISTNRTTEILYYVASIFLPPLGFWWAYKYWRQSDTTSKRIAITCAVLTVIATILAVRWSMLVANQVNLQLNEQLQSLQGY